MGVAIALKEALDPSFKIYAQNVIDNGGTDNHIVLWNVRQPWGLTGFMVERVLESISITVNKNSILGDTSAINPGGVRLGTPALTTRGFKTCDFKIVAKYLNDGCMLAIKIKNIVLED